MNMIQRGVDTLLDYKEEAMHLTTAFISAHAGCVYNFTMLMAGSAAQGGSLAGAMAFGVGIPMATMVLEDKIKPIGCARCVVAKANPLGRYAKMALMYAAISTAVHFSTNHDEHADHKSDAPNPDIICGSPEALKKIEALKLEQ